MFLESIVPYNFRNLVNEPISFSPRINLFLGNNGQGKTNILEAVTLLCTAKSFRSTRITDFIRWNESEASVFGKVVTGGERFTLGVSFVGNERELFIDHKSVPTIKEYIGKVSLVTFSPHDIELIKGPPSERRSFLDKYLVDISPTYLDQLLVFYRALRHKNTLLKGAQCQPIDLQPWNRIIADSAAHIYEARATFISGLAPQVRELYNSFSRSESDVAMHHKISSVFRGTPYPKSEQIYEQLISNSEREVRLRASLIGPHRDDFLVNLHGQEARAFASQGESRSLVLSMKIAVIRMIEERRRDSPIVILDDVDAELDVNRREALLATLLASERQVMISGTNRSVLEKYGDSSLSSFEVSRGSANPI